MFIKTVSSMAALVSQSNLLFSLLAAITAKKTVGYQCVNAAHVLSQAGASIL